MTKQERINKLLQVKKSTGEILTAKTPQYRGKYLASVYGRFSERKAAAYDYCMNLLDGLSDNVISYGITSANWMKFTFSAVFETGGEKYVLICTASYDRIYLLETE